MSDDPFKTPDGPNASLHRCDAVTNRGVSLADLSRQSPVLVVFLRHGGCPFCRETLAQLAEKRSAIEAAGSQIVLVHMMPDETARRLFEKYGLDDCDRISDPDQGLYRTFGLKRGSSAQVMGPKTWWRGFKTVVLSGHLPGRPVGDIYQLPGAFLLVDGKIVRGYRPEDSADQPDYTDLAACELPPSGKG